MRVRPANMLTAMSFSRDFEAVGGTALPVGETLELVHPSGAVGSREEVELRFYVRAWSLFAGDRAGESLRIVEPDSTPAGCREPF